MHPDSPKLPESRASITWRPHKKTHAITLAILNHKKNLSFHDIKERFFVLFLKSSDFIEKI